MLEKFCTQSTFSSIPRQDSHPLELDVNREHPIRQRGFWLALSSDFNSWRPQYTGR